MPLQSHIGVNSLVNATIVQGGFVDDHGLVVGVGIDELAASNKLRRYIKLSVIQVALRLLLLGLIISPGTRIRLIINYDHIGIIVD